MHNVSYVCIIRSIIQFTSLQRSMTCPSIFCEVPNSNSGVILVNQFEFNR